ncbi:LOW QUALITY PROTEIN: hypothetical protein ACHAW6_006599 [Cyclotella cf. meneghiniana]
MARETHQALGISHNLLSAATLPMQDFFFHKTGCEVSLYGEIILRGWRDLETRLWQVSLLPNGGNNIITPDQNMAQLSLA